MSELPIRPNRSGETVGAETTAKHNVEKIFSENAYGKILDFAFRECGFLEIKNELYERADFAKISPISIDKLSCHLYAAARTDSTTFLDLVKIDMNRTHSNPSSVIDIASGVWKCVESPDVGDSVLYYNEVTGKIGHTGIYRGAGKVESKPGNETKCIFTHDLFDVTALYGTHLFFMRKENMRHQPLFIGSDRLLVGHIETIKGRTIRLYSCRNNEINLQFVLLQTALIKFFRLISEEIKKQFKYGPFFSIS